LPHHNYQIPKVLLPHEIEEREQLKREKEEHRRHQEVRQQLQNLSKNVAIDLAKFEVGAVWPPELHHYHHLKSWTTSNSVTTWPCSNVRTLWHGTRIDNLGSIAKNGLSVKYAGRHCLFGAGLYFGNIGKALNHRGYDDLSVVMKCAVAMGNIFYPAASGKPTCVGLDKEYQSLHMRQGYQVAGLWSSVANADELVVYSNTQVNVLNIFVFTKGQVELAPPTKVVMSRQHWLQHQKYSSASAVLVRSNAKCSRHPCTRDGETCCNAFGMAQCIKVGRNSSVRDRASWCPHFNPPVIKKR